MKTTLYKPAAEQSRWLLVLSVLMAICFISCNKNGTGDQDKVYRFQKEITVDGLARTYLVNLPPGYYENDTFALVIAMHGGGGSAEQFESTNGLTDKANASGFIVVYPDGVKSDGLLKARSWNAGTCCDYAVEKNIDDVKFISLLIDKLVAEYKVNARKVYATGHSNGGMMSYRLACELSGKIAAIAPNGCSMALKKSCDASRPVPVLHMHSELDKNVPYKGGIGEGVSKTYFPPIDSVLNVWSQIDGCMNPNQIVTQAPLYVLRQWTSCRGNTSISYYLTKDGGHAWPGGQPGSINGDPASGAIKANDLLWEFFQKFTLP